jgi:hypothetical protein
MSESDAELLLHLTLLHQRVTLLEVSIKDTIVAKASAAKQAVANAATSVKQTLVNAKKSS